MQETTTYSHYLSNWVNANKELLRKHKNKWIAYNEDGLIASEDEPDELCRSADRVAKRYLVYFVDPDMFGIRFR